MSRKDYIAVAGLIRSRLVDTGDTVDQWNAIAFADGMADLFAGDNPRFDRGRFLVACGLVTA